MSPGRSPMAAIAGRSLPASWSWSALVAVATTIFPPPAPESAPVRYAHVLPVPVPACTTSGRPSWTACATASAIAICPARTSPPPVRAAASVLSATSACTVPLHHAAAPMDVTVPRERLRGSRPAVRSGSCRTRLAGDVALPVRLDRANLDGAAETSGRYAGCQGDGGVEVVRLEDEVAADGLLPSRHRTGRSRLEPRRGSPGGTPSAPRRRPGGARRRGRAGSTVPRSPRCGRRRGTPRPPGGDERDRQRGGCPGSPPIRRARRP